MEFTPEVIAALQTLKNAAENDFERHRIAVLERDLTEPPKVEIIDDTHQKFDGLTFRKKKDGHYKKDLAIHRIVYNYYKGEIPADYEIHHIDENKDNNNISNLIMLTKSEHALQHGSPFVSYHCLVCGKKITRRTAKKSLTCSFKCGRKLVSIRHRKIKKCPVCGKNFETFKSNHQKCCSHSCASKLLHINKHTEHYITKTCPVCGVIFERPLSHLTQTCSKKCGAKLRVQNYQSKSQALSAVNIDGVTTATDLVTTFFNNISPVEPAVTE